MDKILKVNPTDIVAVALVALKSGDIINLGDSQITLSEDIPRGHKFALRDIAKEENIIKYGVPIGHATKDIKKGEWVHTHNVKTNLNETLEYSYSPDFKALEPAPAGTFMGYKREKGNPGIRNEVWVLPTVGCVNAISHRLANYMDNNKPSGVDGVYAFGHPYGCSQLGDDHENTRKALKGLVNHPNAGAVLVIGLGCENNGIEAFKEYLGDYNEDRVKFLIAQEVEDEFEEGVKLLTELCKYAGQFRRESCSLTQLVVGLKCGGSDGLSGITANPLVGMFSDKLIAEGASTILTEVPEMFGAETFLMERAVNENVFNNIVGMINGFKDYFIANNQPIYENPSPGNKQGGITTLEDKSLGCTQKGGTAPVVDVLDYGQPVREKGLSLLYSPGNDLVASSALAISGAQLVLFTTGRGTPFGSPVPTVKISTNSALYEQKPHWIDFNAGMVIDETSFTEAAQRLYNYVVEVASGHSTNTEIQGIRELAIFKTGVTL